VERCRSARHGNHVGFVLGIHGKHRGDDLRFQGVSLGKERADGTVDEARSEGLLFAGTTDFPAEKAPRNTPCRIAHLMIIHHQGEKIDALPPPILFGGGDQHHGVTVAHHH